MPYCTHDNLSLDPAHSIVEFAVKGDDRGSLVALEDSNIPFDIKRVYYIWGTTHDCVRGKHAHRNLQQVVICMSGHCDFILDDGYSRTTVHLDSPNRGIHIKGSVWREFTNFSHDCVIMVLASHKYDPSDYITDYEEFIALHRTQK